MKPIDDAAKVTNEDLEAFELRCKCELPDDYRNFLSETNGGFPSPSCISFTEDDRKTTSDVFCFLAVGTSPKWASLQGHLDVYSHRLPQDTIPIARDSCGNLWLLKVGGEEFGSVYFWDHGSFDTFDETDLSQWPQVATSFQEFRDKLDVYDSSTEDGVLPSRWAIVKQATENIEAQDASFNSRANPEFVWHCHIDESGAVRMQFVQYDLHAAATHTDGYSRMRASKGLIEEGPMRVPK